MVQSAHVSIFEQELLLGSWPIIIIVTFSDGDKQDSMFDRVMQLIFGYMVAFIGILLTLIAWCAYYGLLKAINNWSLAFMTGSIAWPLLVSVIGSVALLIGITVSRARLL